MHQHQRFLSIDLEELAAAFASASSEGRYHLNLETGEVLATTEEILDELNVIYAELYDENGEESMAFIDALKQSNTPEWMHDLLIEAHQIEQDDGLRYLDIPAVEPSDAYRDMEAFIETVEDRRLQAALERAIERNRPFRRFKDALLDYPAERERWFAFSDVRMRARALEWLAEEGITVPDNDHADQHA